MTEEPFKKKLTGLYYRLITSRLFLLAGMDTAMIYTYTAKAIGSLCSPLTMWFILTFLTKTETGFYYVIISLLGIAAMRDLGFSNILLLFASHEKSRLSWDKDNDLIGDEHTLGRLAGIMHLGLKWFGAGSILFAFIMIPYGLYFLGSREGSADIAYKYPWILSVVVITLTGVILPVTNIFEGCNRVKEMRMLSLIQPFVAYPLQWTIFLVGFGLFGYGAFLLGGLLVVASWFFFRQKPFIKKTIFAKEENINFNAREMWPLFWRTMLSSLGGFLTVNLFNPVAFKLLGPEEAGKLGVSFALCSYISTMSMPFITNRTPAIGELWAKREFRALNNEFIKCVSRLIFFSVLWGSVIMVCVFMLKKYVPSYGSRFLDMHHLIIMAVATLFMHLILAQSFFIRANKRDPLVWAALSLGLLTAASNWFMVKKYGMDGMLIGYLGVTILMCAVYACISYYNIRKWQCPAGQDAVTKG